MKRRAVDPETEAFSGGDGWSLHENGFAPALMARAESLFSIGDGFLGVRGGFEEGLTDGGGRAEVYLNGVYERVPIHYHEKGHGFAETSDTRPKAPDATGLSISVDGETFAIDTGQLVSSLRRLDFQTGQLTRQAEWISPNGRRLSLSSKRMACFAHPGLLIQHIRISAEGDAPISVESSLSMPDSIKAAPIPRDDAPYDPRIGPALENSPWADPRIFEAGDAAGLIARTRVSGIAVAVAVSHRLVSGAIDRPPERRDDGVIWKVTGAGVVEFVKIAAYVSDFGDQALDLQALAAELHDKAARLALPALEAEQERRLSDYWRGAALGLQGQPRLERAVRFNMFQLLQATGAGGHLSLCAKGQTGEGYEGHYFWDAEIFGLPLFAFTDAERARDMLRYRCRTLDQSRRNARMLGHRRGALIAWRTISGAESSAYFPAGSAQYHINADVAFALRQYIEATGDDAFLYEHGAELLFETARIWMEVGHFNPRHDGAFTIHGVTGPDEYTALVNNNFYTNAMAAAHLAWAAAVVRRMQEKAPDDWARIKTGIALHEEEPARWREAASRMLLPYDKALGIHAQDDAFLDKPRWDLEGTPAANFPLLLHYHPLAIYRHQVCKQADVVLAHFLLRDRFERADIKRSLHYYEGVTVHDSTLSPAVFGIVANQVGETEKAFEYFREAALVDLEDLHGNSGHGLHMASMGGSWMCVLMGFAGMRLQADGPAFDPALPQAIEAANLRLRYLGRIIEIAFDRQVATYSLIDGEPLGICHQGESIALGREAVTRKIAQKGQG